MFLKWGPAARALQALHPAAWLDTVARYGNAYAALPYRFCFAEPLSEEAQMAMVRALPGSLPALRHLVLTYPRLNDIALVPLAELTQLTKLHGMQWALVSQTAADVYPCYWRRRCIA